MPEQIIGHILYCPECNHRIVQQYRSLSREEADLILYALDLAIAHLDQTTFVLEGLDQVPIETMDRIDELIKRMKKLRRVLTSKPAIAKGAPEEYAPGECPWCAQGYIRTVSSVNEGAYVHAGTPVGRVVCTRIGDLPSANAVPSQPVEKPEGSANKSAVKIKKGKE
jgi:hypothetical protein